MQFCRVGVVDETDQVVGEHHKMLGYAKASPTLQGYDFLSRWGLIVFILRSLEQSSYQSYD